MKPSHNIFDLHLRQTGRTLALICSLVLAGMVAAGGLVGCGEKIAIPEAEGLFSISGYQLKSEYQIDNLQQLVVAQGMLFVLTTDSLTKRDHFFEVTQVNEEDVVVTGLDDARALGVSALFSLIFVWEQGNHRMSWYSLSGLEFQGESFLPELVSPVSMTTSPVGVEQLGVDTFLYISDPEAGVIHRYAFSEFQGLYPYGILARADGDAARFVHVPAGLSRDQAGKLLVCDADINRNWVIRFDSYPDTIDVTADPYDEDPLRGKAIWYSDPTCVPPAAADYVLGDAAECEDYEWVGGTSEKSGKFDSPQAVTFDGLGRIFVADTGNNRVQAFSATGEHKLVFGDEEDSPSPQSIGVVDVFKGLSDEKRFYAAYVFLAHPQEGVVIKWISKKFKNSFDEDDFEQ